MKNTSKPKPNAALSASRGGVQAARYNRRGLLEPAEKQIRWHHGAAAFVLKSKNEVSLEIQEAIFYVFDFWY
ncbi:MAG: hypothetical protein J6J78_05015 [Clostridia bacterium]|nr:hypothetical protein [Clostridia bacterium]MBP3652415.1 hypothetical protein [Clostridia bacterium]